MQALHSAQVIFYLTPIIVFLVTVGAAAWRFNIFSGGAREPVVGPGSRPGRACGGPDAVEVGRTGLSGWFEVGLKLVEVGKFQEKQGKFLKSQIP